MFTQKQIDAAVEALRKECLSVFGSTWSYDNAWRFAKSALESAEAEAWQPIMTAPKDNDILLALPTRPDNPSEGSYCFSVACWDEAGWISEGCTYNAALPTHWQPLPPVPTAAASDPKSQIHE
jgi:hypothetical protein